MGDELVLERAGGAREGAGRGWSRGWGAVRAYVPRRAPLQSLRPRSPLPIARRDLRPRSPLMVPALAAPERGAQLWRFLFVVTTQCQKAFVCGLSSSFVIIVCGLNVRTVVGQVDGFELSLARDLDQRGDVRVVHLTA